MKTLSVLLVALMIFTSVPVFACGGGCGGGDKEKDKDTSTLTTDAQYLCGGGDKEKSEPDAMGSCGGCSKKKECDKPKPEPKPEE